MRSTIFRNALALLLSLGLGSAVLAQADDAYANRGDKHAKKDKTSQKSAENQSTQQKAEFFNSWTQAEEPGQSFASYASSGLLLLDDALSSVVEDVRQQPIGGGPEDGSMTEEQKNQQAKSQQALKQVEQQQQEISNLANKLRESAEISQHPVQFHQAATSVADTFTSLQQARFANLENDVKKVNEAVGNLDVTKPLAAQSENIKRFFTASSAVIEKMSNELESSAVGGGPEEGDTKKQKSDDKQKMEDKDKANPDVPNDGE